MGDWTEANNNPDKCDRVTAEDVQRVAKKYFAKDQRNVLIINPRETTDGDGGGEDPRFAQAVEMINSMTDTAQLEQMIGMFSMRMDQVEDPEQKERMQKLLGIASARLEELKTDDKD
jgi:hypothetical protein